MWSQIIAWIGSVAFVDVLKRIGVWVWGYAWSLIKSCWDNAWLLTIAAFSGSMFLLITNMLNSWFAFPFLLNMGLHGLFHLSNTVWVISNWKSAPNPQGQGPKVNINK